jgi:hypothetical protein
MQVRLPREALELVDHWERISVNDVHEHNKFNIPPISYETSPTSLPWISVEIPTSERRRESLEEA